MSIMKKEMAVLTHWIWWSFFLCLGFATSFGATVLHNSSVASPSDLISCSEVRELFVKSRIGDGELVPDSQISGESLSICPSAQSCCTPAMEEQYREASKRHFQTMLQAATTSLKAQMTKSANEFRASYSEMLRLAENNTYILFTDFYKKLDEAARVLARHLYRDLTDYLHGKDVDLEQSVSRFFNYLFPLVYYHSLSSSQPDFSEDYKRCLRDAQEQIRPFGDVTRRVSNQLTKSFQAARTLLQATNLAVEVINSTEHAALSSDCTRVLVKLNYCAHCKRLLDVRPCSGFCVNVASGCLASVLDLDQQWMEFVSALDRMMYKMTGANNMEEVLSILDSKISEAVMHAMESGPEISKRVEKQCGSPKRTDSPPALAPEGSITDPGIPSTLRAKDTSLHARQQHFRTFLLDKKDFYSKLPKTLCSDESVVEARDNKACWNGHGLGEYTKTLAGVGIAAQKYNPEFTETSKDPEIQGLVEKLKYVTREILGNKITLIPESDSYVMEGSGSGGCSGSHCNGDDEDIDVGSGSGDGSSAPSVTPEIVAGQPPSAGSASSSLPGGMLAAASFLLFTFLMQFSWPC